MSRSPSVQAADLKEGCVSIAKAISTFYLLAALQLPRNVFICSCLPRTYLEPVAWIGFVLTKESKEGQSLTLESKQNTLRGTLSNICGPEQSCQPRETCLTVAVIQQWAPRNLTQTLLPGRALAQKENTTVVSGCLPWLVLFYGMGQLSSLLPGKAIQKTKQCLT